MNLKTARKCKKVSLRELAKVIGTSKDRLHCYEIGRFNTLTGIEKREIEKYLEVGKIDWR